jgi:aminoglycoside phosphotransferase family enzyme/predicted kinase
MDLRGLIDGLSRPAAYPHPADAVAVRQTHISAVFLAGEFAYKVRKPVRLGFLDFSTLDLRRHDCDEEVRLNRRLAPDVYLGVVGVVDTPAGLRVGGDGPAVEWAVKMRRLPDGASLLDRLGRGEVTAAVVERLAGVVADFHRRADGGPRVAAFGRPDVVAGNARANFAEAEPEVGQTVTRAVFDRVRGLTERRLAGLGPLIEARAARGVPRDTHGDLHLDHVYLFPDRPPPGDLVVIDCVEFAERFRYADPVADAAFLVMDLAFRGRRDLARAFADAYFRAAGDEDGRPLLPFYTAYRAVVRAKVEGLTLREPEVPAADREANRRLARGHWLLALGELEDPGRRPALVLVAGLPGTGKSTLARELAGDGFAVVRTDEVRRELFPAPPAGVDPRDWLYDPERTARVYGECLRRAEAGLLAGGRVAVDANFRDDQARRPFADLADGLAVPRLLVVCEAAPEVVRGRLAARRGDASDADWAVHRWAAGRWQDPGPAWAAATLRVATDAGVGPAAEAVRQRLRADGLLG